MDFFSSSETLSSASRLKIHSCFACSTANCFCAPKPGHAFVITRAPQASAIERVLSVELESTTTTSSAHATDSQAALIFGSSLKLMMVALICIFDGFSPAKAQRRKGKRKKLKFFCVFLCAFAGKITGLRDHRVIDNYVVRSQRRRCRTL